MKFYTSFVVDWCILFPIKIVNWFLEKQKELHNFNCVTLTHYISEGVRNTLAKKQKFLFFLLKYTFLKERGDEIEYGRTNQRQEEFAGNQRVLQRGQTSAKELSSDYSWA